MTGKGSVDKRGAEPLSKISSPSPFKERGIKGVRSIIITLLFMEFRVV